MIAIVVSGDEKIRKRIEGMLEGIEIINCDDFYDAIGEITKKQNECRLVLADFNLTPLNGIRFLEVVRKINRNIQTILIIRKADEGIEMEALKSEVDLIIECSKANTVNRVYIERLIAQQNPKVSTYIEGNELIVKGKKVVLTRKEMEIARILIGKEGEIVGREEMIERIWRDKGGIRKIDLHIKTMRSKLKRAGLPNCIITVSGVGYRWVYDEETRVVPL